MRPLSPRSQWAIDSMKRRAVLEAAVARIHLLCEYPPSPTQRRQAVAESKYFGGKQEQQAITAYSAQRATRLPRALDNTFPHRHASAPEQRLIATSRATPEIPMQTTTTTNQGESTSAPTLRRALNARHLTMIAIGGSIGTGLFVASGASVSQAGPGGA